MDNNANLPEDKVKKTEPEDDIIFSGKRTTRPPMRAKRDIKQDEKTKTRIVPFVTGQTEVPPPENKKQPSLYEDDYEEPLEEEDVEEDDSSMGKSILQMLGKGLLYLVFVISVSVILAYYAITMGNDIFAFVKDANEVEIVLDEGADASDLAELLHDADVIDYPWLFKMYNTFKNRNSKVKQEFVADTYVFTSDLNYDELIAKFEKSAPVRTVVTITFPEGLSIDEMIDIFIENGIGSREDFEAAVKSSLIYDMKYKYLTDLQELERAGFKDGRKYALEGYLYPDTYEFFSDTSEIDAISKLLRTFNVRFEKEYYTRCEELGMTVDEVVNLAAIVQKETKYSSEYPVVSSLYHNRLNAPATFPRLQCDSTYLYSFPERRDSLTLDEMKQSSDPYSTYSHDGLPPSAICNPSLDAIIAALYPNGADADGTPRTYYYMVAKSDGYHYFARTEAEHLANVARSEAERGQ